MVTATAAEQMHCEGLISIEEKQGYDPGSSRTGIISDAELR